MKTKQLIVMSALAIAGLTSCEKDLYDPTQDQEEKKVTDLVVPDNFPWEMTKAANCNVTSDHSAQLSIYLDEACTEGNLLATVSVKAGSNLNLPLSILKNTQKVYIQYVNATGKKTVVAAPVDVDGHIGFAAPADSQIIVARAASRAEDDFEELTPGTIYYPKGSGGTMMFEDQYPALGDYDFNDFVARYSAVIETVSVPSPNGMDDTYVKTIKFRMTVEAIGGVTAYVPCLRLPFKKANIATAVIDATGTVDNAISLGQETDKSSKENIVFLLNGAEKNDSKPSGSQYLNTEEGFATTQTKRITLTITFKENEALLSDLTSNLFDIFLCKADKSEEIHMLGYEAAFKDINTSFIYDPAINTTYKQAGSNLVWAISIPDSKVTHTFEKTNFLKAYPDFAIWAENGGASATDWYQTHIDAQYLFK